MNKAERVVKCGMRGWVATTLLAATIFLSYSVEAAIPLGDPVLSETIVDTLGASVSAARSVGDTLLLPIDESVPRFVHRVGLEARRGYLFPTNRFLQGNNNLKKILRSSMSAHVKYSFQSSPGSCDDRIYGGAYQGLGVAWYKFGDPQELGNPTTFYLFQGARIARIASRLSCNYEWNFGLSTGWKPYDETTNPYNKVIGSHLNAYLNVNFYLNWMLLRHLDLFSGVSLTHFSNGNTQIPNAGLNAIALQLGVVGNFNRRDHSIPKVVRGLVPRFHRYFNYDLVLFGSWRRKGIAIGDARYALPDAYTVLGVNFATMYNLSYKFRLGVSLDAVYDGSANVYLANTLVEEGGSAPQEFVKPALEKQLALGVSGRIEYVMPYFTVGIGLGTNVLHGGGDLKSLYQVLALKIQTTRNTFLHIGYNLHNFQTPNYLMLGVGVRFNNKHTTFR